jgi:hypothetical protein
MSDGLVGEGCYCCIFLHRQRSQCRRRAPPARWVTALERDRDVLPNDRRFADWPIVEYGDWCGEFEPFPPGETR